MITCLNCANSYDSAFCNVCGQNAATRRLGTKEWRQKLLHKTPNASSGFFVTLKTLLIQPGDAIRAYLQGQRKLLLSPFSYMLILCGLYIAVSHFFEASINLPKSFTTLQEAFQYIEANYTKLIVIAMVIPMTVGTYLAYFKSGFNLTEHCVLNVYLMAQLLIVDILLVVATATNLSNKHALGYTLIEIMLKFPYWIWTYWNFFKPKKWLWGILQIIFSMILSGIFLTILMMGAAFILLKSTGVH
jgi:hypothetical protein